MGAKAKEENGGGPSLTLEDGYLDLSKEIPLLKNRYRFEKLLAQSTFAQLILVKDVKPKQTEHPGSRPKAGVGSKRNPPSSRLAEQKKRVRRMYKLGGGGAKLGSPVEKPGIAGGKKRNRAERESEDVHSSSGGAITDKNAENGDDPSTSLGNSNIQGARLAVKVLNSQFSHVGVQEASYLRAMCKADPHGVAKVVRWVDVFMFHGHVCVAMELLGPSLSNVLASRGKLPISAVRKVACDMLGALAFLHESVGIIHADLKPENICCKLQSAECSDDESMNYTETMSLDGCKIIDFGNAMRHKDTEMYENFEVQSFAYRAPEVLFGLEFGPQIDIWSLGCILAELATGKVLFSANKPHQLLFAVMNILGMFNKDEVRGGKFFAPLQFHVDRLLSSHPEVVAMLPKSPEERLDKVTRRLGLDPNDPDSDEFVDFLLGLLTYDPRERMRPVEALCHPFVMRIFPFSLVFRPSTSKAKALQQRVKVKRQIKSEPEDASNTSTCSSTAKLVKKKLVKDDGGVKNKLKNGAGVKPQKLGKPKNGVHVVVGSKKSKKIESKKKFMRDHHKQLNPGQAMENDLLFDCIEDSDE